MRKLAAVAVAVLMLVGVQAAPTSAKTKTLTITNTTDIVIDAVLQPTPYPTSIAFPKKGRIKDVNVTLHEVDAGFPQHLDILLVHAGRRVVLWSDAGGAADFQDRTVTFDDSAPTALPEGLAPVDNGTYKPGDYGNDVWPGPAPQPINALSVFKKANPKGKWDLYVFDDEPGGVGLIEGWSITVTYKV